VVGATGPERNDEQKRGHGKSLGSILALHILYLNDTPCLRTIHNFFFFFFILFLFFSAEEVMGDATRQTDRQIALVVAWDETRMN